MDDMRIPDKHHHFNPISKAKSKLSSIAKKIMGSVKASTTATTKTRYKPGMKKRAAKAEVNTGLRVRDILQKFIDQDNDSIETSKIKNSE